MNNRRNFLKMSSLVGAAGLVTACGQGGSDSSEAQAQSQAMQKGKFDGLPNMMAGIAPISVAEHEARIAKAQELMAQNGFEAIYLEATSNLWYYTGMRWGQSERMAAAIIPREGEVAYTIVFPVFEIEVPPFEFVNGKALGFHRASQ